MVRIFNVGACFRGMARQEVGLCFSVPKGGGLAVILTIFRPQKRKGRGSRGFSLIRERSASFVIFPLRDITAPSKRGGGGALFRGKWSSDRRRGVTPPEVDFRGTPLDHKRSCRPKKRGAKARNSRRSQSIGGNLVREKRKVIKNFYGKLLPFIKRGHPTIEKKDSIRGGKRQPKSSREVPRIGDKSASISIILKFESCKKDKIGVSTKG